MPIMLHRDVQMSEYQKNLKRDLEVAEVMVAEMGDYLGSETLFWPMSGSGLPRLTLGGYLLRQFRLLALRELLNRPDQERLDQVRQQFEALVSDQVVRVEERAHRELKARSRQWSEYLGELASGSQGSGDYYRSAVETRAMIQALIQLLSRKPYRLDQNAVQRVRVSDQGLRGRWEAGSFIWSPELQPAYPENEYWWLYGRPR